MLTRPLVDALRLYVFAAGKLLADDAPLPVLALGNGKPRKARLWTYVRDDRFSGEVASPVAPNCASWGRKRRQWLMWCHSDAPRNKC